MINCIVFSDFTSGTGKAANGEVISVDVLAAHAAAVQEQLCGPFADAWDGAQVNCRVGAPNGADVGPNERLMGYWQTADQPGAAGYHATDPGGRPYGKVFLDDGATMSSGSQAASVIASHEACEMTLDATANLLALRTDGVTFDAYEACLDGDTLVHTADGLVPIRELATRGGFVDVLANDQGATVRARAGHARLTKRNIDTVSIRFSDGSTLRCTANHKILTSKGYVRAGLLTRGVTLPALVLSNLRDGRAVQSKTLRKNARAFIGCADESHVSITDLRHAVGFPEHVAVAGHAPLLRSVAHVRLMCAEEEVIGPHASTHVAGVAHEQARRDHTFMQLVREAVHEENGPLFPELPIPCAVLGADPQPTSIRFLNTRPEAVGERRRPMIVSPPTGGAVECPVRVHSLPMGCAEPLGPQRSSTPGDGAFGDERLHLKSVDAVEPGGKTDVYDLTVPGLRNFAIGAGIFVHNCDAVEDQTYTASNGVEVSDFLTFAAFDPGAPGPYDHLKVLQNQYDQTPDGYRIVGTATISQTGASKHETEPAADGDKHTVTTPLQAGIAWRIEGLENNPVKRERKMRESSRARRRGVKVDQP